MGKAADKAIDNAVANVMHEINGSMAALNVRERIAVLDELIDWAVSERDVQRELLEEIEWAGTSPLGGQD